MLTLKQNEFCKLISNGSNGSEAYQIAYKSTNLNACKVGASKMLKSKEIQDKIKEFQDLNKSINQKAHDIASQNLAEGEIADKIERMKYLSKMMRGEITINEKFACGELGVISEPVEPNFNERIKAIAELNKMEGDYAPTKVDNSGVQEFIITRNIIQESVKGS